MTTVRAALASAVARLAAAGVPDPARDARRLMAAALGVPSERLTLAEPDALPSEAGGRFTVMLEDRGRFRPVAQIVGRRLFWGRDFAVTAAVLDPRPETETLVALALSGPPPRRLLDLGTGSGALLITLLAEWPDAVGIGTDVDADALAVAARNTEALGVARRATLRRADWFDGLWGDFDLVVSNPPYIAETEIAALAPEVRDWEPRHALTAGPTGLEAYRAIAAGLSGALAPAGRALLEIGVGQGAAVAALFRAAGFAAIRLHPDLDGRDRVIEVSRAA